MKYALSAPIKMINYYVALGQSILRYISIHLNGALKPIISCEGKTEQDNTIIPHEIWIFTKQLIRLMD